MGGVQAGRLEGELGKERAMHAAEVADLRMRLQALEQVPPAEGGGLARGRGRH